jgi:Mrp family chromosome partitioning ATPase/predicted Fe-Mo cluster-binding NifX family protein
MENRSKNQNNDFTAELNKDSHIKKVIGVVSGKGGVGKSLVTSMMAVEMKRKGLNIGILDADITGPSIPKAFGLKGRAIAREGVFLPMETAEGIRVMSINLLLPNNNDPVVWRGPLIGGTVKQFWTDVAWGDLDYLFIDMPPGTGDVPLTVFQSIRVDGIVIVTSPQELVSMIVSKAARMAEMMHIPIIGLVENMAYFRCPDCDTRHNIFGKSHTAAIASQHGLKLLAQIPIDPKIAEACDHGAIEKIISPYLDTLVNKIEGKEVELMKIAVASDGKLVSGHFGHCEGFLIFEADGKVITQEKLVANPGHKPGFLPNFLHDHRINVIISGGMGGGAVDLFNEKGIQVVTGASGSARQAAEDYLSGLLNSDISVCNQHQHQDQCH